MEAGEGGAGIDLPRLRTWIVANGGEVLADQCTDHAVHYRSIEGPGSVVATAKGYEFTGDGRLALSMSRIGSTLNPFGLYATQPVITPAARPPITRGATKRATVISDASLCDRTGAAGWASWMIADGMPSAIRSGEIEVSCASSTEAELIAVVYALRAAAKEGYAPSGAEVLIQSDNANALSLILKAVPGSLDRQHASAGIAVVVARKAKHSVVIERYTNEIRALVRRHSLTIHVRHVPGHTAGDGRQWVNRQCDRLAKQHMRKARSRPPHPDRPGTPAGMGRTPSRDPADGGAG